MIRLLLFSVCFTVTTFQYAYGNNGNFSRLYERFLVDGNTVTVTIDSHHAIHTVSDKFVSLTLDSSQLKYGLRHFHSGLKKIRNLAKGLAPAYLRVGGTAADSLSFKSGPSTDFIMDERELDTLYHFARDVGWDMIFDLNLLHRHHGEWDSTNAESLMKYAASKGYRFHLELGNEPNLYERRGIHVDPAQIGRDYGKLKHLMNSIHPFNEMMLVGPAFTGSFHVDYAEKFLSTGSTYIDAMTVHQYYMDGSKAKAEDFLNPDILDNFKRLAIHRSQEALSKHSKGTKTTWVLETSSAYGGGAPVLSESFIAGFTWLDELGMAAANGIPVVARQNFVGAHYSLVANDNPLPDYWLTLLHKRLVGRKVLKVTSSEHNRHFRIYAHCSKEHGHPHGVTFFFQNMLSSEVKLNLEQYTNHYYELYILTAGGDGSLTSKTVKLNGHELHMNGDSLPTLSPVTDRVWPVKVPGHSFGFLVSPHADASACP
ncbi:inactive heparanase-2-like isoform X1 [Liolophura sinensis]|uniref:inactive heparanase-2-like isoform X1 n=1 Tax=Liolophura sinensis TaxID=3198878 RepID=UPI00315835FA